MSLTEQQYHSQLMRYQERIKKLENELDEMTGALSQAWDQLVPFLQEIPRQAESTQDIVPILQAVLAAADTDLVGIYLFKTDEWSTVPTHVPAEDSFLDQIKQLRKEQTLISKINVSQQIRWTFVPIFSERERIGVLGVGLYNIERKLSAVEMRILTRMADRIGDQVAATQLARFREREAIQMREMQIARDIQQSALPVDPPKHLRIQIASYWQPAKEVGGDAWGWVQQKNGCLAWFVLDVAGKGLPAALAAVALHTAISMALRLNLSPADTLHIINEEFYDAYTRTDLMATVVILSLNPENGVLHIANAGHPPVLVRHNGNWLRLAATVPPIGVLPTLHAELQSLTLSSNDLVIAHTDGFSEIQTKSRLWGQTGLLNTIPMGSRNVETLTQQIVTASQHAGSIDDDQTLITTLFTTGESDET
jgi:serine phosphatase RsbU (regulator of sigma subunit)